MVSSVHDNEGSFLEAEDLPYFLVQSVSLCLFVGGIKTINIELLLNSLLIPVILLFEYCFFRPVC